MKVQASVITLFVVALASSGYAAPAPAPQIPNVPNMVGGILGNVNTGVNRIIANPLASPGNAIEMANGIVGSVLGNIPQLRVAEAEAAEDESE